MIEVVEAGKAYVAYTQPYKRLLDALFGGVRHGREFWALRNCSFEVMPGETLGIVGRNGAGKSTLLQMLSGVLQPSEGRIAVAGKLAALLELGAGFNPEFTGRENARLNAAILGLTSSEIDAVIDRVVEFSELGDFIEQPVKTYSTGMYVRLAFSVAIHVDPAVLVIDEALAVGDARFQAKCMERIRAMKACGVTILFVSHDVGAVRQLCDRVLWLEGGRVRMLGDVLTVTSRYMEALFGSGDAPPDPPAFDAPPSAGADVPADTPARAHHPLVRWGSHVGSILDVALVDEDGRPAELVQDDARLELRVRFRAPSDAARERLAVAFSIKDTNGTDLFVSTTLDAIRPCPVPAAGEVFEARFAWRNMLAPGDYLLVVALEDRRGPVIDYFDYIEGARYFSTVFSRIVHGRIVLPVEQGLHAVD
ncbi:ABC transporter ATP-binding protein [Lysobacter humi (ex Lee et al. 2017)]